MVIALNQTTPANAVLLSNVSWEILEHLDIELAQTGARWFWEDGVIAVYCSRMADQYDAVTTFIERTSPA